MRLILSSAVLVAPGEYRYRLITREEAVSWLLAGPFVSYIGYEETALALSILTEQPIHMNRQLSPPMQPGDEALVFRLCPKPGSGRITEHLKGRLGIAWVETNCEIGILRRTS